MTRLRRLLYLIALAQLPFATLMGLMFAVTDASVFTANPAASVVGAFAIFFAFCLVAALPAWFLLGMGRAPRGWKGALIPASVFAIMIVGVQNYNLRTGNGNDIDLATMVQTSGLMLVLLGIPGALIGRHMRKSMDDNAQDLPSSP